MLRVFQEMLHAMLFREQQNYVAVSAHRIFVRQVINWIDCSISRRQMYAFLIESKYNSQFPLQHRAQWMDDKFEHMVRVEARL